MRIVNDSKPFSFFGNLDNVDSLTEQILAGENHKEVSQFAIQNGVPTLLFESGLLVMDEYTGNNQQRRVRDVLEFARKREIKISSVRFTKNENITDYIQSRQQHMQEDAPTVAESLQMFDSLIAKACRLGAQDVVFKLSSENNSAVALYKVDGELLDEVDSLKDYAFGKAIAAAVFDGKEGVGQAKQNFDEATTPQETEFEHIVYDSEGTISRKVHIRFTKSKTAKIGELLIDMRILPGDQHISLSDLELPLYIEERVRAQLIKSKGAIITSGPTGAGKSTTLFSALLEFPRNKLIQTIEDPIEIRAPKDMYNITQNSLDKVLGYKKQLSAILRQAPDGIYVTETRDNETADLVFQIAKSGHFVMTSVHANTASGIISRLMDLGITPFDIATKGAVEILLAQRLVKKLCQHCAISPETYLEKHPDEKSKISALTAKLNSVAPMQVIKRRNHDGCKQCHKGEIGRQIAIEMIDLKDKDREFIGYGDITGWQTHLNKLNTPTIETELIRFVNEGVIDITRAAEHIN